MARTTPDRKPPAGARRKSRGFQRAGATARPVLDNIAGKHGFAEADVLLNWPHIAGEALSATCQPVKVTYGSSRSLGAVLVVQATSARAPEVEHRQPECGLGETRFDRVVVGALERALGVSLR